MSTFAVKVARIRAIEPIENADVIELAVIGDYRSVVRKGDFRAGDLAVYVPEASLVPEWLLEKMGLTGKLTGKLKNRVKAMKLRGCLSQG
ncbi:RNA ligase (ATP), partial [Candidatus Thorarchaeota archaeon]